MNLLVSTRTSSPAEKNQPNLTPMSVANVSIDRSPELRRRIFEKGNFFHETGAAVETASYTVGEAMDARGFLPIFISL